MLTTTPKTTPTAQTVVDRSYYQTDVATFHRADPPSILWALTKAQDGAVDRAQRVAWEQQIAVLKESVPRGIDGLICFEFVIPRIGKRADNVLVIGNQVVVIEFKVGAKTYDKAAKNQVIDYALDLRNFHLGCRTAFITPVLVSTNAPPCVNDQAEPCDGVYPPLLANRKSLPELISQVAARAKAPVLSHAAWLQAGYRPTPTIVEASQALFQGHQVSDITRSEAGADNLCVTTEAINALIDEARDKNSKVLCLVSGVPGAGKTLAGLNLVTQRRRHDAVDIEHAIFLSGNGPLVKVLQEALARDEVARSSERRERVSKAEAHRKAVAFIQNVHHFRDESLKDPRPPVERVVVFDEAQRAWNRVQTTKFMQQKRGQPNFDQSEPQFLISVMDRQNSWVVIVCLVGGGQEINTGEAGLEEWLRAIRDCFPHWLVYLPDQLDATEYLPTFDLRDLGHRVIKNSSLHLSVSLRSFRSERVSAGIAALISGNLDDASVEISKILSHFPIFITRSLSDAKRWLRNRARGSERFGLLASSGGKRLKPLGINMDVHVDPCVWFLNNDADVRSSFYLEDAASEFDVQGLELDWAAVIWDGDLIHKGNGWHYRAFKGTRWHHIRNEDAQRYRLNAYRVLLTRARQGMVIVVPHGDSADPTRSPHYYNPTWEYLRSAGLPQLVLSES